VSGVSWYDHDGDAYFSLETVFIGYTYTRLTAS